MLHILNMQVVLTGNARVIDYTAIGPAGGSHLAASIDESHITRLATEIKPLDLGENK